MKPLQCGLIGCGNICDVYFKAGKRFEGIEIAACADLIEALLRDRPIDPAIIAERVRRSRSGEYYDGTRPDFPPADLDLALRFDCFDFAMQVTKKDGLHVLQAVPN